MSSTLRAPVVVEFPFTRSLGPVQRAFLTGLRERTVLGVRTGSGRVLVPPVEYDPDTAEEIGALVRVGTAGTVTTWAWNPDPRPGQPPQQREPRGRVPRGPGPRGGRGVRRVQHRLQRTPERPLLVRRQKTHQRRSPASPSSRSAMTSRWISLVPA